MRRWIAGALAAGLLAAAGSAFGQSAETAIVGADVLPMTGVDRLDDQTVLIRGDRIVAVGPRADVPVPAGARVIRAEGMTLMPGLVDMHVHIANQPGAPGDSAARSLDLLLANGITTARSMVGGAEHPALRDRITSGERRGPTLILGAPGISANAIQTPDAARAHVRAGAEAGFDFIKIFSIANVEVWNAVRAEAEARRIPLAGHVSNVVGLDRALASGMQMEHLDATLLELLPADSPLRAQPFGQFPSEDIVTAASAAGDDQIEALARRVAAAGVYQVPTLSLFELFLSPNPGIDVLSAQPGMRYYPRAAVTAWTNQLGAFRGDRTEAHARRQINLRRRLVAAYHRAGAPIMAGTDGPQGFHLIGEGLIREMEALADAGLSNMAVLRSATVVPRDYFRTIAAQGAARAPATDFGVIEPGARADLLLLRGDPGRDLNALRQVETVVLRGQVHDRAALDSLLDGVVAAVDAANAAAP